MCCGTESRKQFLKVDQFKNSIFAERSYTDNVLNTFQQKGIAFGITFFIIEGFLFWFLTIMIENGYFGLMINKLRQMGQKENYSQINEVVILCKTLILNDL